MKQPYVIPYITNHVKVTSPYITIHVKSNGITNSDLLNISTRYAKIIVRAPILSIQKGSCGSTFHFSSTHHIFPRDDGTLSMYNSKISLKNAALEFPRYSASAIH
jgi:hypothetical protein